jgi:hypothetical protein
LPVPETAKAGRQPPQASRVRASVGLAGQVVTQVPP